MYKKISDTTDQINRERYDREKKITDEANKGLYTLGTDTPKGYTLHADVVVEHTVQMRKIQSSRNQQILNNNIRRRELNISICREVSDAEHKRLGLDTCRSSYKPCVTPLEVEYRNHLTCMRYFIATGDTNHRIQSSHVTPLMIAAKNGYTEIVRALILNGEALDDQNGVVSQTALMMAVHRGRYSCAKLLTASPHLPDAKNRTAIELACKYNQVKCIRLLLEHGAIIVDVYYDKFRSIIKTPSHRRVLCNYIVHL